MTTNFLITKRKQAIKLSANLRCHSCGSNSEPLDIHHIDGNHSHNSDKNLEPLCPRCHTQKHRLVIKPTRIEDLETGQEIYTKNVIVRLTPAEKLSLFREAQKLGISTSAFTRLLLQNWTDKVTFHKK